MKRAEEQRLWDECCMKLRHKLGLPMDYDFGPMPAVPPASAIDRFAERQIAGVADRFHHQVALTFYGEVVL